jgi:DNA (cytosine-5)-methyltransferase 1
LVFNEVCDDLEREGYEVQSFLIPAASVGAPHQRQRIWFVANTIGTMQRTNEYGSIRQEDGKIDRKGACSIYNAIRPTSYEGNATNPKSKGLFGLYETGFENNINRENTKIWGGTSRYNKENNFINFPTQSPVCGGDDGLPKELDNITFSKWRKESIKGYGNAIVPQVAYEIFKAIQKIENVRIS